MRAVLLCVAAILASAGCHGKADIREDAAVREAIARAGRQAPLRFAVAPVRVEPRSEPDLEQDPTRYPATVDVAALQGAIADAVALARGVPADRVRRLPGPELADAFREAYKARDDVVVEATVRRLDCVWRGYNWLWIPNMAVWLFAWVPSFWVPDEDFAIEGEVDLRFYGTLSERIVHEQTVRIDREGMLHDFQRGWSFTGIVTLPQSMEPADWNEVAETLREKALYAVEQVAATVTASLGSPPASDATVFALACGVKEHARSFMGPAGADADAHRFADALVRGARVPRKNVLTLTNHDATKEGVEKAFAGHLARARAQDTVVVFWSGLGAVEPPARGATGAGDAEPLLLPFEFDGIRRDVRRFGLPLERLRGLVGGLGASRVLIVLDAGFGGRRPGARSLVPLSAGGASAALGEAALARLMTAPRRDGKHVTLIVAAAPGEDAIDLDGETGGLLSYYLAEGIAGDADQDGNGTVSTGELQAYLEREVPAQAGLERVRQHPRVYRHGAPSARDDEGSKAWLPTAAKPQGKG